MSGSIMGSWQSSGTRLDTEVSGLGIYIGIPIIWQVQNTEYADENFGTANSCTSVWEWEDWTWMSGGIVTINSHSD